jgi:hypothetical protein
MIISQVGTQAKVGGIKFLVVELNNWNCFIFQVSSLFSWKYVRPIYFGVWITHCMRWQCYPHICSTSSGPSMGS